MILLIPFVSAVLAVLWIHPKLVRISLDKNIVDNPNSRKLQRTPIPVLGGMGVFCGILIGIASMSVAFDCSELFVVLVATGIMLYTGTLDDILDMSPWLRLFVEISAALLLIYAGGCGIDDFHGLWGVGRLPQYVSVPLSVIAMVGIINALNLIDGVDGLSSGLCMTASAMFGLMFYLSGDMVMVILAVTLIGALIPFFLHNVFGKSSKMFIGDGGTYVMGVIMCVFVGRILHSDSLCGDYLSPSTGLVSFTLAVLSIPVFDTVRVMSMRMLSGNSPFHPDKTHLHHLFIDMGFSHVATMLCIVIFDGFVVLCWWLMYKFSIQGDVQLYVVVALGILETFVFYAVARRSQARNSRFYKFMLRLGRASHIDRKDMFLKIRCMIDKL